MKYRTHMLCACLMLLGGNAPSSAREPLPPLPVPKPIAVPLPERKPAPRPLHPGEVETADWTAREIEDALERCARLLGDTGAVYRHLEPLREGRCGTPAPIELSAVGKKPSVAIEPPGRVTCELAANLGVWSDTFLQQAARTHLDTQITGIRNVASYVCRNRYNAAGKPISKHARANALDMAAFRTAAGGWIGLLDNWALPPDKRPAPDKPDRKDLLLASAELQSEAAAARKPADAQAVVEHNGQANVPAGPPPPEFRPKSAFLYDIHAGACELFGTVLGPEANEAHKDHFHFDMAPRRHGNYCE